MLRRSAQYAPLHSSKGATSVIIPAKAFDTIITDNEEDLHPPDEEWELRDLSSQTRSQQPADRSMKRFWNRLQASWRRGAFFASLNAAIVLLINFIVVFYAIGSHGGVKSIIQLSSGSCKRVEDTNKALHWLINGLGTLLLSSSNYCMQCLSAPTRQDIDQAHRNRSYLHIGVHSFQNLGSGGRKKLILWAMLAFSSIPLHLM